MLVALKRQSNGPGALIVKLFQLQKKSQRRKTNTPTKTMQLSKNNNKKEKRNLSQMSIPPIPKTLIAFQRDVHLHRDPCPKGMCEVKLKAENSDVVLYVRK